MVAHPKDPGKETLGTGKSLGCVHTNQTCFSSSLLLPAWLQEAASLLTLAPSSLPHRCNLFTSGLPQPLGCQHHLPPVSLSSDPACAAQRSGLGHTTVQVQSSPHRHRGNNSSLAPSLPPASASRTFCQLHQRYGSTARPATAAPSSPPSPRVNGRDRSLPLPWDCRSHHRPG